MKKSAIFTLLFAVILGLSLMSCGKKETDQETKDATAKATAAYDKAIADFTAWTNAMAPADQMALDAIKAEMPAKFKMIQDAQKVIADNYEKNWKPKMAEEDIKKFDETKTALDKKAGDAQKAAQAKIDGFKFEAPAPVEPAPEPKKK
jgi:uncharacterized lipoprotein YehR (DUF1307 family)